MKDVVIGELALEITGNSSGNTEADAVKMVGSWCDFLRLYEGVSLSHESLMVLTVAINYALKRCNTSPEVQKNRDIVSVTVECK